MMVNSANADVTDISYRVNEADEIVRVNEEWNRFAAANDGADFAGDAVLHRSLWDFIGDETTRELYHRMLTRIRAGHPVHFTFRCDSPGCRRRMAMQAARADDGSVEFRSTTIAEEPRAPLRVLDRRAPRSAELLRMCGWCQRVRVGDDWTSIEEAVDRLHLFETPLLPKLTHGICDDCYEQMQLTLAAP